MPEPAAQYTILFSNNFKCVCLDSFFYYYDLDQHYVCPRGKEGDQRKRAKTSRPNVWVEGRTKPPLPTTNLANPLIPYEVRCYCFATGIVWHAISQNTDFNLGPLCVLIFLTALNCETHTIIWKKCCTLMPFSLYHLNHLAEVHTCWMNDI